MHHWPHLLLALALSAGPLRPSTPVARAQGTTDSVREELEVFFHSYDRAARSGQRDRFTELFDVEELIEQSLAQLGQDLQRRASSLKRNPAFVEGVRIGLGDLADAEQGRRHELVRYVLAPDGRRVTAVLRQRDADGTSTRLRVWLRREDEGWRLYDFEDVLVGLRATTIFATVVASDLLDGTSPWLPSWLRLMELAQQTDAPDYLERAEQLFAEIAAVEFPPGIERVRRLLAASVQVGTARIDEAAANLEGLDATLMPLVDLLWAGVHLTREDFGRSLEHARAFLAAVGDDADGRNIEGQALVGLARPEQARAAFEAGLEEEPDHLELLVGLGSLAGAEALAALDRRFRATTAPAELFEGLVIHFLDQGLVPAATVLVTALRELAPGDPNADYYGARLLGLEGRHAEAARMLHGALARVEDSDEFHAYLFAYAAASVRAGTALEAYAEFSDTPPMLDWLADLLEQGEDVAGLRALADEHGRATPGDARAPWLRARAHLLAGERDGAEVQFAAAMAGDLDDWDYELVREARIANLLADDRWQDAYDRVPPAMETFLDLAHHLSGEGRADALAELVERHRASQADPVQAWFAFWDAEVLWLRSEYGAALAQLQERRAKILVDDELWRLYRWEDRVLRCLLRLGRLGEATELALEIDARDDDPHYSTMVHAAAGRFEAAAAALRRLLASGWTSSRLYGDPDLGAALLREDAAPLRAIAPPP